MSDGDEDGEKTEKNFVFRSEYGNSDYTAEYPDRDTEKSDSSRISTAHPGSHLCERVDRCAERYCDGGLYKKH